MTMKGSEARNQPDIWIDEPKLDCMIVHSDGKAFRPRVRIYSDISGLNAIRTEVVLDEEKQSGDAFGAR